MKKKLVKNILIFLLLFSTPQTMAMHWEKYIVPIGLVAASFTIFFYTRTYLESDESVEKNQSNLLEKFTNSIAVVRKTVAKKSIPCCSLEKIPEIEDFKINKWLIYETAFHKKCKVLLNNPDVCNNCCDRFLISIKKQRVNSRLLADNWKLIFIIGLIACKFHCNVLPSFFFTRGLSETHIDILLDAATLFKNENIISELLDCPTHLKQDAIKNSKQQSPQEIIERNLKGSNYQYDVVANFFETMLHRAKTDGNKAAITKLLDTTLKDKIDEQLDLLFIVIKHKYKLLEETLKKLFGLTLASKNSKKQTLYHRTYQLYHSFDSYSKNQRSLVSVIKRLCDEQVCGINDPDSYGKTALHYAIELCYKLWSLNLRHDYRDVYIKQGTNKFGLRLLLTHPSIDLTIKDEDIPLIWKFFEYSPCVIKDILARENFHPYQVFYKDINFLNKFFMIIADGYHEEGKCLDFTKLQNAKEMTQQLKLLAKTYDTFCSSYCYAIYEKLAILISLYIRCGGSVTQSDENQLAAVDIAYRMYIASKEQYNALLHANNKTDYEQNKLYHQSYSNHTKTELDKALTSLNTKEMIYHIYLTHTPDIKPEWHRKYWLLKVGVPVEIAQYISKFYFNLTIEREVDRDIAFKVKNNFDFIKQHKYEMANRKNHLDTVSLQTVGYIPEVSTIDSTDLVYYHKTKDEKEQCRQEILQEMLCNTSNYSKNHYADLIKTFKEKLLRLLLF